MMKKIHPFTVLIILAALLFAGCGVSPASSVNGFLSALRNSDKTAANNLSYDKVSSASMTDVLEDEVYGTTAKIGTVVEKGPQKVREKGYKAKVVESVESRMAAPRAQIENRYKPMIDQANAVLSNTQSEYNNAVAMKNYAAVTYGPRMPQYYAEVQRINNILPRMHNAQAKVDTLKAQQQNEIAALKAGAEEQYKQEKSAGDKDFARHSVTLPESSVAVELVLGGSAQHRTFRAVKDGGKWKVYSVDDQR